MHFKISLWLELVNFPHITSEYLKAEHIQEAKNEIISLQLLFSSFPVVLELPMPQWSFLTQMPSPGLQMAKSQQGREESKYLTAEEGIKCSPWPIWPIKTIYLEKHLCRTLQSSGMILTGNALWNEHYKVFSE